MTDLTAAEVLTAAYFVVALRHGREHGAVYWHELPKEPIRNLVYIVRLDTLPNGHELLQAPVARLYAVYRRLKERGALPPRWEPPPQPKAAQAERLIGHREEMARSWDSYQPGEPHPHPDEIKPKPKAPARIIE